MGKYDDEIKAKAVEMVKAGKSLASITKDLGPNPKAIQRYCEKAGVIIPKKEKAPKKEKVPKADAKAVPAPVKKV